MQNLMGRIRRCAEDYNMICEGDKIAVYPAARIRCRFYTCWPPCADIILFTMTCRP